MFKRFIRNTDGNFGIIFGLMLVPMMGLMGAAVDYSSILNRQSKIQTAADTALLAAARDASTSTDFYRLAESYLLSNLDGIEVKTVTKANPKNVTFTITNEFETAFLGILGKPVIEIEVYSEVLVDKFGRGSAQKNTYSQTQLMTELDRLEAQLLKQIYKLPPRAQEKARRQIEKQIAYLKRRASSQTADTTIRLSQ